MHCLACQTHVGCGAQHRLQGTETCSLITVMHATCAQCCPNRRSRCGCHGLNANGGRFADTFFEDELHKVCTSLELRMSIIFYMMAQHNLSLDAALFHGFQTRSSVTNSSDPCLLGYYLRQRFEHRNTVCASLACWCCSVCLLSTVISPAPLHCCIANTIDVDVRVFHCML